MAYVLRRGALTISRGTEIRRLAKRARRPRKLSDELSCTTPTRCIADWLPPPGSAIPTWFWRSVGLGRDWLLAATASTASAATDRGGALAQQVRRWSARRPGAAPGGSQPRRRPRWYICTYNVAPTRFPALLHTCQRDFPSIRVDGDGAGGEVTERLPNASTALPSVKLRFFEAGSPLRVSRVSIRAGTHRSI